MEPPVDVEDVVLRAQRNWAADGLVEIMLGLTMTVLSGLVLAISAVPRGPFADFMSLGGVQIILLVAAVSIVWGFKTAKRRITFPRCGYVALPRPTRMSRVAMLTMFAAFGVIFTLLISTQFNRVTVPLSALVFALAFILPGLQVKVPRMIWEGVLTLLFGALLFWFTDLTGSRGLMALMGMMGASMVIIGALRLRRFLKSNPLP
jgi:hypothetical protein